MGTISETQKSGEPESTEKSQLGYSPIRGDGYAPAYAYELWGDRELPTTGVQFLNLESILRLKMVYVYFPAIVLKMTSRTQARYGKLTNV